jgi:ATP-dependent DNA helicase RecG
LIVVDGGLGMSEQLLDILNDLMNLPTETEWIEFKEAKTNFDSDDLGRYFSALSNEANLNNKESGWLVFGITNSPPRRVVGTDYRNTPSGLEKLKKEIQRGTNHLLTFTAIHETNHPDGRVIMFEIPPAPRGIPTAWRGRTYGRTHESIDLLSFAEIDRIRNQKPRDWSAEVVGKATIEDLDQDAIAFAREEYRKKHPQLSSEVERWSDGEFLNRIGLCVDGGITNAAIILLGRGESTHLLSPLVAQITWILKDAAGIEKDYAHFGPPFILAVDLVFAKIRNLNYRYMTDETLFPIEQLQYDTWVMRETLHNCIAHQDYLQAARISVVEGEDYLLFTNRGIFIPGSIESLITGDRPPDYYRNRLLAEAMVKLNMIDTVGSGIKRMFRSQRERNFPLPDYDLTDSTRVSVRITGKVIDPRYTRMLIRHKDLDMLDVIALDKVQKGYRLSDAEFKSLKSKKLIEGRRPNLYVSEKVAVETDTKEDYIRKRSFDKQYFMDMVIEYLKKYGEADRRAIEKLLLGKVSDVLTEEQKRQYIKDLLKDMRKRGIIETIGKTRGARWILSSGYR